MTEEQNKEPITLTFDNARQYLDGITKYEVSSESIDEVHIEHFLEYLDGQERIEFFNKLDLVLAPAAKVHITVPYYLHPQGLVPWAQKWPPFSEHSWLVLDSDWRSKHPYTEVFGCTTDLVLWSYEYSMASDWTTRHDSAREFGIRHYAGVVEKLYVTLVKPDPNFKKEDEDNG